MSLSSAEPLLAGLFDPLDDDKRLAVLEAARHERIGALAAALGQPDAEVLGRVAAFAGLDVASDLRADARALRLLPARLVHEYQILPIAFGPSPAAADDE